MTRPRIIIVDGDDRVIGHKERGTLVREDIYRVSALWVTDSEGNILLAQRKLTKTHDPGKWGPAVAGTLDEGETYESNVIKEAEEEIGLKDIAPIQGPRQRISGEYNFFDQWYMLTVDRPAEEFTIQEEEVEQVRWLSPGELRRELIDHPENYLEGLGWPLDNCRIP